MVGMNFSVSINAYKEKANQESKTVNSFPNSQFFAEGYRMFRKDRNKNSGGLILYTNEDIPGKLINS